MKNIKKTLVLTMVMLLAVFITVPVSAAAKISNTSLTMIVGQKKTLKITGTTKKVTWSSSKKKIVSVTKKGVVTAKKRGTAVITAKAGSKKYTCKVTAENPSLNKKNITLDVGNTYRLKLNGTKQKVAWKSSDSSVAAVSGGNVTAKKAGTVKVTGQSREDGMCSSYCQCKIRNLYMCGGCQE